MKDDNNAPAMDAWTMSTSILVGINRAIEQAKEELRQAEAEAIAAGRTFTSKRSKASQILEALLVARRTFDADLRQLASSSGLVMPKGC